MFAYDALRAQARRYGSLLCLSVVLGGCSKSAPPSPPTNAANQSASAPVKESLDYAEARRNFHTVLIRKGPAPQPFGPAAAPAGVEVVEFPSGELRLKGWFAHGKGEAKRWPAVLFLHNAFAFGAADWEMSEPFRQAGFAVMTPLLRGENGQPGNFSMFYDEVDDVIAAGDYLAKRPDIDGSRMFLAGHSTGGTLTLLTAEASSQFTAAASFSGSPDYKWFLRVSGSKIAPHDLADENEIRMRSAGVFAGNLKCPTRIFFGAKERFFVEQSVAMVNAARANSLDVDALSPPGDHGSAVPEEIRQAIEFFRTKK